MNTKDLIQQIMNDIMEFAGIDIREANCVALAIVGGQIRHVTVEQKGN